ncbi:MAG: class I SAM-dependent methyltransferase [Actinomycetota bacterium]
MSGDDDFGLDDAYAVETPDDNRRLYAQWASTYDSGFLETQGYVYDRSVATAFVDAGGRGPVLDLGCGTGAVGIALAMLGVDTIDGLDISPEMLEQAATKQVEDRPVYRRLVTGDLLAGIEIPDGAYAGVVSAGTFTHGHVGSEALGEVIRVGAPGCSFAIGINSAHYELRGFADALRGFEADGAITDLGHQDLPIYENNDSEHGSDLARVVRFVKR